MLGFGYGRLILSGTVLATTALGLFGLANSSLGAALVGETRRVDLGQKAQTGIDAMKALYKRPASTEAFDKYYFATHVPIAKKIAGLVRYEISTGPVGTPQGPSPYHLVAILSFDSIAAVQQALASPEGQATAADLANFAQTGVDLLICDTKDI